jgi:hypothetical protein
MPSRRILIAGLVAFSAAGLFLAARVSALEVDMVSGAYFLLVLTVIGVLDVWLPRGDYSEMGGALVLAAGLLVNPLEAVVLIVVSRVMVWATRRFGESPWRVLEDVARRLMLMSWASVFFVVIGGTTGSIGRGDLGRALAVAVLFFVCDMAVTQLISSVRLGVPFLPLLVGNLRLQGWLGTAQVSAAVLAVLTFGTMGALGLIIVTGLLLVMRQSFSLLIEVRQAYRSTVEVLARAIEAHDPERRGHAERVGRLSTEAGRLLGWHGKQLEALTHAALFHDVSRLDSELPVSARGGSADVLANVGFLAGSVPMLRIIDLGGDLESSQVEEHLVGAYVICTMSEYDDRLHGQADGSVKGVAAAIGARLYADTRRSADKAIRRVELRSEAGRLATTRVALEEAW